MKKLTAMLTLALMAGTSTLWASTPCSGTSVANTTNFNWTRLPGEMPALNEVFHSNNYNGSTPSGTECGNLFIFAGSAGSSANDYPTSCDKYYEPNIYRGYAHQCELGEAGVQLVNGQSYNNIQCQRNNHKACTLPK